MVGKTISHYKILKKLGSGGMGDVYKAEDTKLQRIVALKFLPLELTRDKEAQQRFVHEARAASALDHPNIGTIYEINESDGFSYIAMAYYEGDTVKDKIDKGPLPVDEAIDIAIQIARGLAKAHEKEIVHRDIKPANILLTDDGQVKIVDFGLAKLGGQTRLTKTGMTMGTVAYMSPEQTQGTKVDHRTDIWSLGIVLYEMLTGELPFKGDYEQAVLYSIVHEDPEFITNLRTDLPNKMERIVERALTKKSDERFQTIDKMLSELETFAMALRAGKVKKRRIGRLAKKQRMSLFRLLTFAAVLLVALAVYLWRMTVAEATPVSIAILPLKNLTQEAEDESFTYGMTDALLTDMTKIAGIRVISLSSVMRYRDNPKPIPKIAEELNVDYVIDGTILKEGEIVRVSPKLVHASKNEYVWAETYERNFKHILKMQAEIARAIAKQVQVTLTPNELEQFEQAKEVDPEAYAAYLRGRYYLSSAGPDRFMDSVDEFGKAIELEPDFAAAHAGLADAFVALASRRLIPAREGLDKAEQAAFQALRLDSTSSEAYTALGYAGLFLTRDWEAIERNLRNAIRLNPSNTLAHQWYSLYLTATARHDQAIVASKKAVLLDPLSPQTIIEVGLAYYYARDYEQAIREYEKALEIAPNHPGAHYLLAVAQAEIQAYDEALKNLQRAIELSPKAPNFGMREWLGKIYAHKGERQKALEIAHKIRTEGGNPAVIYIALGQTDKAFQAIDAWFESQHSVPLFKVAPWFDPIRSDARFKEVLRRAGLE